MSGTASNPYPRRILFVFAWLVVGGEETEVRLLARLLDPARYRLEVVACFHRPGMPEQTHLQLEALGVAVDRRPYSLSFEDTVKYLSQKIQNYSLVVGCQAVPDLYPALERLSVERRPPLIEHGGLVEEALRGPKHLTARYVGVCASIREAAASRMADRPQHALEIPSMVDLSEFDTSHRETVRATWGFGPEVFVTGWVGRLDRKKRVEDFIRAASLLRQRQPRARFVIIGGPDAFMPEYEEELRKLAASLELDEKLLVWTGDRPDVPKLLAGLDSLVWLSRGEGMPHIISEAGAAGLPVIATLDNGSAEQIKDEFSGIFVPHEDPFAVARAVERIMTEANLAQRLGTNLKKHIEQEYSAVTLTRRWEALFDQVIAEVHSPELR